jgi:hypothetical protein
LTRSLILIGLLVTITARTHAQTCPAVTGDFAQNADIYVKKSDASCTVADGGYVKSGTTYKLHTDVTVAGWCQVYSASGNQCVLYNTYLRTAVWHHPYVNPPPLWERTRTLQ